MMEGFGQGVLKRKTYWPQVSMLDYDASLILKTTPIYANDFLSHFFTQTDLLYCCLGQTITAKAVDCWRQGTFLKLYQQNYFTRSVRFREAQMNSEFYI